MRTQTMEDYWDDVELALKFAKLVAFDGCHKIYMAMDSEQEQWFRENYDGDGHREGCFTGTQKEMLARLKMWWNGSCGLRFISAVSTNNEDPNMGFEDLIPQGADENFDEDGDY